MLLVILFVFLQLMKPILNKFLATLMSIIVFMATTSFTVDMHFCGNNLVDVSLFSQAKACVGELITENGESCGTTTTNCCVDTNIVVDGVEEMQLTTYKFSVLSQLVNSVEPVFTTWLSKLNIKNKTTYFKQYLSPNFSVNLQTLFQVFRI